MKGKRYGDVDAIQKASTAILNAIPKDDLKKSFDNLLDRANRRIQCAGTISEATNKMFAKENQFLFFYIVLELLNSSLYERIGLPALVPPWDIDATLTAQYFSISTTL